MPSASAGRLGPRAVPLRRQRGATVAQELAETGSSRWPPATSAGSCSGGLVDEVALDVVPVVFGTGKRYFGPLSTQVMLENPDDVVVGDRVLHLRFRVRR